MVTDHDALTAWKLPGRLICCCFALPLRRPAEEINYRRFTRLISYRFVLSLGQPVPAKPQPHREQPSRQ